MGVVSVIIPVYNAEKSIEKTIDSIICQSFTDWELILVNDGSTDSTLDILESYKKKDNRLRIFSQSNSGPAIARNKGIEEAQGDFLCFIDADDFVRKDYLEKLLAPIQFDKSIGLVCGGYYELNAQYPKGLKLHDFKSEHHNKVISRAEFQSNLFHGVTGVLWGKIFRSEIFKKNGIRLHPELRLSEDLLAVLEYSFHIENVHVLPDTLYYYNRMDENSLSGKAKISNYKDLMLLTYEIEKHQDKLPFLDLKAILFQRKFAFISKLLRDHSGSKNDFYKIADFIVSKEQAIQSGIYGQNAFNNKILKWIFDGKYYKAWLLLKVYTIGRKIKHG